MRSVPAAPRAAVRPRKTPAGDNRRPLNAGPALSPARCGARDVLRISDKKQKCHRRGERREEKKKETKQNPARETIPLPAPTRTCALLSATAIKLQGNKAGSVHSPSTSMATSAQYRQLINDYGPPSLGYTQGIQGTSSSQVPQSKYAELLAIIEELGKEIRPTYAGSKSAMERLKRGIIHARGLVRECLAETERNARS
ncbi:cyclin-dependent kinase 2-associated protein 1 isoform X1 [Excalfactoria chinensis]|uniref:cyclin-dependent kinase 2-associated protein 1 isoform X1 n=1 Tax=Excalfactoria chinensis TaxID=46218 RepID=UPI003B3AA3B2